MVILYLHSYAIHSTPACTHACACIHTCTNTCMRAGTHAYTHARTPHTQLLGNFSGIIMMVKPFFVSCFSFFVIVFCFYFLHIFVFSLRFSPWFWFFVVFFVVFCFFCFRSYWYQSLYLEFFICILCS